jgi:hypothetical protein
MRPIARVALAAVGLVCFIPAQAQAQTLWYSGDANGVDGLANVQNGTAPQSRVYTNFAVPNTVNSWTVTGLSSFNYFDAQMAGTLPMTANWSIRSGVFAGNGGSVLASGTSSISIPGTTGRSLLGLNEYGVIVPGLNISLVPGTYWFNVTPVSVAGTDLGGSYQSTTSGANAVTTTYTAVPFLDSTNPAITFGAATGQGAQFSELSGAVLGTAVPVPEPVSVGLAAAAVGGLVAFRRRRATAN